MIDWHIKKTVFVATVIDRMYQYNPCTFGLPIVFNKDCPNYYYMDVTYRDEWVWRKLVAAILCCNERASKVRWFCTKILFKEFSDASHFLGNPKKLETIIKREFEYWENIVPRLLKIAHYLVNHNYHLPSTKHELMAFEGVGEHIAELIVGNCFNDPAVFPIDRHVIRICQRLELILECIYNLEMNLPILSNKMASFGIDICSHKPTCHKCCFRRICAFYHTYSERKEDQVQQQFNLPA